MWRLPAVLLAVLLALVAIAPANAHPPCGVGVGHDCPTPTPGPSDPLVAVNGMLGFETQAAITDNIFLVGTAAYSTVQKRTGAAAIRCNPASGAAGNFQSAGLIASWTHFGLYIATMPSVTRVVAGSASANTNNIALKSDGTLDVRINATVQGTSAALSTNTWYWIGWRNTADSASSVALLQIDGTASVTGNTGSLSDNTLGAVGTEASAIDIYIDDVITDSTSFLAPSKVGLAVPISDSSRVDWTNDAAGTANLFDALDNKPPVGIADTTASTGLHQIRDATNGTDTYVANMTTYTNVGVGATDTLLAVQVIAATGAPVSTGAKLGSFTVSNPTIANASFGTFYHGSVNAGTFPTGWILRAGAVTASPTVTLGNSPVVTVQQDTSSTRIAMVCALGVYVAWTPFVAPTQPYFQPMPPLLAQ